MAVVSDRKVVKAVGTDISYYADVVSSTDYYAFGMVMADRSFNTEGYRYGFNGKENDNEVKGTGNSVDFGDRMYDSRLGRWLSVDMQTKNAPGWTPYRFGFNNPLIFKDPNGQYETDGHYWTIYLVGLMIGLKPEEAEKIAYNAEKWDTKIHGEIAIAQYTWADPKHQQKTHALTGGYHANEEFYTAVNFLNSSDEDEQGQLLHRYGDTYAHSHLSNDGRMYGIPNIPLLLHGIRFTTEHAYATEPDGTKTGTRPDKIYERPELYVKYVQNLAEMMALKYKKDINGFDVNKFKELADYAKNNKVSLLGIINYEVAAMQGQNTFMVHKPIGPEMVSPMKDYQEQVQNTKNYLDSKGIKYTTEEVSKTRKNGEKVILGTKFKTQ